MSAAQWPNFMRVTDDSMCPEYIAGDILQLEPRAPCEVGNQVLIRTVKGRLVTGRLITRGDGMITVQFSESDPEWELLYDSQIVSMVRVISRQRDVSGAAPANSESEQTVMRVNEGSSLED
jgi:phage repressor protein C with HTH and peptisase S24 domain